MKTEHYIFGAATPEEHLHNVFFQGENVEGWLIAGQEDNALTKAECLLDAAQKLVAVLKKSDAYTPQLSTSPK